MAAPDDKHPAAEPGEIEPGAYRLVDYHLHTPLCGHATGALDDYVRTGIARGLYEIGFSDHLPLLNIQDESLAMSPQQLPEYVSDVRRLRERFPGVRLKLGIEADYVPSHVEETADLLRAYSFDYVHGSVHFIDAWGFDDPRYLDGYEKRDLRGLWERYFELLAQAAESGLFDILAHPDLIKKFGMKPPGDLEPFYREAAERIAATDVAIEVSTAGLRKPVGEIYPAPEFLRLCCDAGVPVTLGSDAHKPEEVGAGYDVLPGLLRECGCREISIFEKRRRMTIPFP